MSNEDFRKVFDRPFVAPRPFESGPQTSDVPTSHYDYNFDEKDYKCEFIDYFQLFTGSIKTQFYQILLPMHLWSCSIDSVKNTFKCSVMLANYIMHDVVPIIANS